MILYSIGLCHVKFFTGSAGSEDWHMGQNKLKLSNLGRFRLHKFWTGHALTQTNNKIIHIW